MTDAFRQKQIREILDEDLRINRKVLDRTFKMVRTYDKNSIKEPSPLEELVSWNIDKQISNLQEAIQNVIDGAINNTNMTIANEDISKISTAYNLLVSYIQNFAKSHKLNQRDKDDQRHQMWDHNIAQLLPTVCAINLRRLQGIGIYRLQAGVKHHKGKRC